MITKLLLLALHDADVLSESDLLPAVEEVAVDSVDAGGRSVETGDLRDESDVDIVCRDENAVTRVVREVVINGRLVINYSNAVRSDAYARGQKLERFPLDQTAGPHYRRCSIAR